MSLPQFSSDWLTRQVWQFEQNLRELPGTPCRLLEIGCYEGRATCWLLDNIVTHPDASLLCLDIFEQPVFRPNIGTRPNASQVHLILGPSRDSLRSVGPPASFDFIYIDGGHGSIDVLEDAVLAFRLLKVGGVIGFDDYKWKDKSLKAEGYPKPAIDVFLDLYDPKIEVLGKNYQVWIRKIAE